jgi:hypothetical protein
MSTKIEDYKKCIKVMRSCITLDQLEVAWILNVNFFKKWKDKKLFHKLSNYHKKYERS